MYNLESYLFSKVFPRFRCCFVASVEGWDTEKKDRAVQRQTFAD